MKNGAMIIIAILFICMFIFMFRYGITVHSPIIVKVDRWTGNAWVANNGVWMEIQEKETE